jgi:branched-chain amino acid aminotransferase
MFRLADHFNRLKNSAKILSFDDFLEEWNEKKLEQVIKTLVNKNKIKKDAMVRITIFTDGILSGTKMIGIPHKLAVFIYDYQPILPLSGASLLVSSWRRISDNAIPARAKINGGYVNSSLIKNEALSFGFDDAIALDDNGHITESSVSNIFLVKNNQLMTPSTDNDILEGITRDTVRQIADDLNIICQAKPLDRTELYTADEIFLSGSSVSITPVIKVDNRNIGDAKPGSITQKISNSYNQLTHGQLTDKHHWLTRV